ncbi:hypothetical protein [Allocoleopsis franciscana]|uniref:Uncharacterized protein n=1 Tax=Allocoleopsis franciscana PCC 7113 TaxID=1173027 RepID=K9WCH5_9CYAN|nr:hypothetical protein [Allocoleopsis franciscana]AFZ18065.1 hypothetical protein Mic7113_2253 [Allocoleopsis franciscana PCC 7113]
MNIKLVLVSTLIGTIGLTVPVTAQIRNPSQDFFERGREQLEREIQVLQGEGEPFSLEGNLEQPPSEQILEVSPSPIETPDALETPNQPPIQVDNPEQENQQ